MKKDWPAARTNEEAERFVAEANLTDYEFSTMVPVSFELHRKAGRQACACRKPYSMSEARRLGHGRELDAHASFQLVRGDSV